MGFQGFLWQTAFPSAVFCGLSGFGIVEDVSIRLIVLPCDNPNERLVVNPDPVNAESPFFDYTCDRCGARVCERVQIMNLALDNIEDLYCLPCLAAEQEMEPPALAEFARDYVYSRDCFKTPWQNFNATPCPRLTSGTCYCQDPASA